MKKKLTIILSIILLIIAITVIIIIRWNYLSKVEIVLNNNLEVEFNEKRKISSFIKKINGKIISDKNVNTLKLGDNSIKFSYINDNNIKVSYSFNYKVVDKTPPVIWLNSRYSIPAGSTDDLANSIMCGDNYDSSPKCYIEGDYNINEPGKYNLVYKAIDSSNNTSTVNFTLNVYEKSKTRTSNKTKTSFSNIVEKHKTSKTKIGIDVSKWQKDIDFQKIKDAGVEFVIIRIGGTRGIGGEHFIDEKFQKNIEEAKKYNIPVGLYFYSYANSKKQAIKDAKWIIKQIKDYDIDLPIAYDWEDWSNFNNYNVSFYELTEIANAFMNELKKSGYDSMLYSSKNYLENIWLETKYKTWLAHYTEKTNYTKDYYLWQLCENGEIDGIDENVDIDIMYLK